MISYIVNTRLDRKIYGGNQIDDIQYVEIRILRNENFTEAEKCYTESCGTETNIIVTQSNKNCLDISVNFVDMSIVVGPSDPTG